MISGAPAPAHHSFPAECRSSNQGELSGKIVGVWFKNPHVRYRMEVTSDDGTVSDWDIQTTSVTSVRRVGWGPDTLTVGETVRVWGDLGHGGVAELCTRGMQKPDASSMGFSVGHWQDDALVIETTNLSAGTLDGSLLPTSGGGERIVEPWVFSDDRLTMERTMTIYDPYYRKARLRQRGSARRDALEVFEPAPCDPHSYFRDLCESGHLEAHLAR